MWGYVILAYGIVWGAILLYTRFVEMALPRGRKRATASRRREGVLNSMQRCKRFLIGGLVIIGALSYIMYGGMQQAMVYFKMPSELKADESRSRDKFLRMGGMVVKGSLQADVKNLTYRFDLSDGMASIPVLFKGIPPDLFTRGKRRGRRGANRCRRRVSSNHDHGQTRRRVQSSRRRPRRLSEKFRPRPRISEKMTATVGHTSILLALFCALWGVLSPILSARLGHERYFAAARAAILGQFLLVTLAAVGADLCPGQHRFFHPLCCFQYHQGNADLLSRYRPLGRPRGFTAALGMDSDYILRRRHLDLQPTPP